MKWFERQQKVVQATEIYKDVNFTNDELCELEKIFNDIPSLALKGPDDKFEEVLDRYIETIKYIIDERNSESVVLCGPIYGVPWIEVDFGQRSEGWVLFVDKEKCIKDTQKAYKDGSYGDDGGYLGPENPLYYFEIPTEGLERKYVIGLSKKGKMHTDNNWMPKYKGNKFFLIDKILADKKGKRK